MSHPSNVCPTPRLHKPFPVSKTLNSHIFTDLALTSAPLAQGLHTLHHPTVALWWLTHQGATQFHFQKVGPVTVGVDVELNQKLMDK
jgi:hypothetical protein